MVKFNQFRFKVYIAGPYSGRKDKDGKDGGYNVIEENIQRARSMAILLAEMGYAWFCPHLNCYHFEIDCNVSHEHEIYLPIDFAFLSGCDAVILLEGWEDSWGTKQEIEYADSLKIPVFTELDQLDEYLRSLLVKDTSKMQMVREEFEETIRTYISGGRNSGV